MSYLSTRLHLVWSTKHREPLIHRQWQPRLHGYMRGALENLKSKVFVIGGVEDHVHVYCSLSATITIADLVSKVKSSSSGWVHDVLQQPFGWQDGYSAFTMSTSADEDVMGYILKQGEHHMRVSYQEELIRMLEKFQIPYDPRYVFL
jgi:putative transposase